MKLREYIQMLNRFNLEAEVVTLDYKGRPESPGKPQDAYVHPEPVMRRGYAGNPYQEYTKHVVLV